VRLDDSKRHNDNQVYDFPRPSYWAAGRGGLGSREDSYSEGRGDMKRNALVVVMALVFVFTAIADVVSGAENQPLAFKNYVLGVTELEEVKQATPGLLCRKCDSSDCDDICYAHKGTIAGAQINSIMFSFYDGKLEGMYITFKRQFFDDVNDSMKKEYGPPTREEIVTLKNFSGETIQGKEIRWTRANGVIKMEEYSSNFDISGIHYSTFTALEKFMKRETQHTENGAKAR
jgi:hypothetical protein